MTPKEKAKELVDKYLNASFNCNDCDMPYCDIKCTRLNLYEAKQCALIAVGELWNESEYTDGYYQRSIYWNEVKQEIEKL